jgi:hypothetical protein
MDQQQQGGQSAGLNASMAQQASSMMQQWNTQPSLASVTQ